MQNDIAAGFFAAKHYSVSSNFKVIFPDFRIQHRAVDTQDLGCFAFIAIGLHQRFYNFLPLRFRRLFRQILYSTRLLFRRGMPKDTLQQKIKIPNCQFPRTGGHTGPLQHMLQFPYIPFPLVFFQQTQRLLLDTGDKHTVLFVDLRNDMFAQGRNILHPLAQRRQLRRQELRGENILYMSPDAADDSYGDALFMHLYQEAGYKPNILFRSADTESILMMVAAEEGISILPDYCTDKLYNADNLAFVPLVGAGEEEEIIAAWQNGNANPALGRFLTALEGGLQ